MIRQYDVSAQVRAGQGYWLAAASVVAKGVTVCRAAAKRGYLIPRNMSLSIGDRDNVVLLTLGWGSEVNVRFCVQRTDIATRLRG